MTQAYATLAARRTAHRARDAAADGAFVAAIATTGIYCRPSCAARAPRPENVRYYDTPADAEAAGYRACRRCRPDGESAREADARAVAAACRRLEAVEDEAVPVARLAADAGMSVARFGRAFKAATGVTPRGYLQARRRARVQAGLADGASVTAALHDAGFGSASRFYAAAPGLLGMAPARARAGGAGERIRYATAPTALGLALVATSAAGVVDVRLGDDADALAAGLRARFPQAELEAADAAFAATVAAVVAAVDGATPAAALPLDIRGTAFQQRVWQALAAIPPGETRSYGALAAAIGSPAAVRAVGSACGANRHAVLIPCHRAVKGDGGLSGYRWGPERKRALLARERG
jgi:AraC family transcriptional regulator, regulatory protein of adaptative response / methylated-DNA-[protein]-cysteine methyltransferase